MDSWFGPQATDNASGNACMLELARVFAQHRAELRRGLVIAFWMGHETGTMISSSRFADIHWDWLRRSCVAYLQIDQPAITGTSTVAPGIDGGHAGLGDSRRARRCSLTWTSTGAGSARTATRRSSGSVCQPSPG